MRSSLPTAVERPEIGHGERAVARFGAKATSLFEKRARRSLFHHQINALLSVELDPSALIVTFLLSVTN